jgi:act minimal PKS ketosynthase (KS/KS alpha)
MTARRVAITGLGAMAPGGQGLKSFWTLLTDGRTATRPISLFDPTGFRSRIAAEIDFDPASYGLGPQEVRRLDRFAQLAIVSTREAVSDAGLDLGALDRPERVGVSIGTAVGATMSLDAEYRVVSDGGRRWAVDPAYASPHLSDYIVPSSVAAEVALDVGAMGPCTVVSDGCTSGLDAIGHAADLIRAGCADIIVAGASDAPISPITVACFDAIRATSPDNDDAENASRPFDLNRRGFVLGEGAASLILEDWEHAEARGARIYAEFAGFANRCNAFHMTGLQTDGREMAEAIGVALRQAGIAPDAVDYVNAHGSGTKQNDRHETAAVKVALGSRSAQVPMSSIKSMIGHSLGAVGALELVASVLAIRDGVIPPTANLHNPDPECDLDYVPLTARDADVRTVLSIGSGFGGFQSAVVLSRPELAA